MAIAPFAALFSGLITRKVPVMVPVGLVIALECFWLQRRFRSGKSPDRLEIAAAGDPEIAGAPLADLVARTLDQKEAGYE